MCVISLKNNFSSFFDKYRILAFSLYFFIPSHGFECLGRYPHVSIRLNIKCSKLNALLAKYPNKTRRNVSEEQILKQIIELDKIGVKMPYFTDEDFIGGNFDRAILSNWLCHL